MNKIKMKELVKIFETLPIEGMPEPIRTKMSEVKSLGSQIVSIDDELDTLLEKLQIQFTEMSTNSPDIIQQTQTVSATILKYGEMAAERQALGRRVKELRADLVNLY